MEKPLTLTPREALASTSGCRCADDAPHPLNLSTDHPDRKACAC